MKKTKGNITQSRLNTTKKTRLNRCKHYQSIGLIPTKRQLSLFSDAPTQNDDELPAYALQIRADRKRSHYLKFCILYDPLSEVTLPGVYSHEEASCFLEVTRGLHRYPEPFKRLLIAVGDRNLTTALEILESELGLRGDLALEFLRKFQACGYSLDGGAADA